MLRLLTDEDFDHADSGATAVLDDLLPQQDSNGWYPENGRPPNAGLPLWGWSFSLPALWFDAHAVVIEGFQVLRSNRLAKLAGLLMALSFLPCAWLISEPTGVSSNVRVAGVNVEGLSLPELRERVKQLAQQRSTVPVRVTFSSDVTVPTGWALVKSSTRSFSFTPRELAAWDPQLPPEAPFQLDSAVAQAYLTGRELSWRERLFSRWRLRGIVDVPLPVRIDAARLARRLRQLSLEKPVDAVVEYVDGTINIIPDQPGLVVDESRARNVIEKAVELEHDSAVLPAVTKAAGVTVEMLSSVTAVRARVAVPITSRYVAALTNARLASESVHSVVVLPGQTLSLNRKIGERTAELGYEPAPIFSDRSGHVSMGIGGGVCCVSTAVFQAAVLGGFTIVERHEHAMPVRYARVGTDAAVYWGAKDLRIRNDTTSPLVLLVEQRGRKVFATVLGSPLEQPIRFIIVSNQSPLGRLRVETFRAESGHLLLICRSDYKLHL